MSKRVHCQNNLDEVSNHSRNPQTLQNIAFNLKLISRHKIMNNIGKGSLFNTMLQQEEIMQVGHQTEAANNSEHP